MSNCFFNYISATDLVTYSTNIGDNVNNNFTVNHNLGTKDVSVTVRDTQTNLIAYPAVEVITLSSVRLSFNFIPSLTAYDVTIFAAASTLRVEPFSDRVVININEQPSQTVSINVSSTGDNVVINAADLVAQWGSITGILSTQTDLWSVLSAKALQADLTTLSGQFFALQTLIQTFSGMWSQDIQTLTYTPSSVQISISNGNTITMDNLTTKPLALAYAIAL
jgi:hypothetical protein